MTSPAPLDYAPAPPWQRRLWFRRTLIAVCVLAFAAAAWRWGPEKWQRAKLLYWQRQCLNYSPPADEVVFDANPEKKSSFDGASGYVSAPCFLLGNLPAVVAAIRVSAPWQEFCNSLRPNGSFSPPVIFMHERRAPSGNAYLIVVWCNPGEPSNEQHNPLNLRSVVLSPANWGQLPAKIPNQVVCLGGDWPRQPPQHIRIFSGQIDPADPSHFFFVYEVGNTRHTIDGTVGEFLTAYAHYDASGNQQTLRQRNVSVTLTERQPAKPSTVPAAR